MDFLSGMVSEVIVGGLKTIVKEIKHLFNLSNDAKCLQKELDRVKSIVADINNQLSQQGRRPKPVVRNWLSTQEEIVTSAENDLIQYEEKKHHRLCWCCPDCCFVLTFSRNIRKSLAEIDEHLKKKDSDFPRDGELTELPGTVIQPMENELVGKDVQEKLSQVETWLLQDESVRVIGIYGMPGVGKTSVLKEINNNQKVADFFKLVIWVTVSKDSDMSALQRRIFERIELLWRSNLSVDEAAGILHSVFTERQLLLILDDVWVRIDVSKLGISSSDKKSKVLLTSRDKNVCKSMEADKMFEMKHLPEEEGWELFCRGAFVAGEIENMDGEIESSAREIAKECKGHPLAIKTLAQTVPHLQSSSPDAWEHILKQLKAIDVHFYRIHQDIMRDLFKPLKHSYDALETDELKHCFLYLAAYREAEEIDVDELIQLWLAEGLVENRQQGRYDFLQLLQNRCLVEIEIKEKNGLDVSKVRMHDVLRDMAVYVSEVDQNTMFRAGQSLTEFPKNVNASLVRISLMHNNIRSLPDTFDCEKLLSLLLSWNTFEVVPEGFLENLNMLKVLDLSNTPIKSLPESIQKLKNLIYIRLSNTQIRAIPDRIFELSTLQFLDLSFSPLKAVRPMINKLKSLQILKLAHCGDLGFVSCDISRLTGLEELDMWQSLTTFAYSEEARMGGQLREASLQDVCKLQRLKRLRLTLKSSIVEGTVGNLSELQELWLLWMPQVCQTNLPTDMRAMHNLERVHLYNWQINVASGLFPELKNLKYLKLESSEMLRTLSGLGLGRLSNLKEIEIEKCILLKDLGEEFGRKGFFPKLRKLKLWILPCLESLCNCVEEGALDVLQTVSIFYCKNVKLLPPGLVNLKSLRQIRGDKECLNEISRQNKEMKNNLQPKFVEILEAPDNFPPQFPGE